MPLTAASARSQTQRAEHPLSCRQHRSDASCRRVLSWTSHHGGSQRFCDQLLTQLRSHLSFTSCPLSGAPTNPRATNASVTCRHKLLSQARGGVLYAHSDFVTATGSIITVSFDESAIADNFASSVYQVRAWWLGVHFYVVHGRKSEMRTSGGAEWRQLCRLIFARSSPCSEGKRQLLLAFGRLR